MTDDGAGERQRDNGGGAGLEVLETGPLALVEDLGRPGFGEYGVGPSGAADRGSLRRANRLVGNAEGEAAVEVTLGGLVFRARSDLILAVTGAPVPITVGGRAEPPNALIRVVCGQTVSLGFAEHGLRSYVAVRGGIDVPHVLGSRSSDVLADIGPPPVQAGTVLDVGPASIPLPDTGIAPVAPVSATDLSLRVIPGPRDDWFTPAAFDVLWSEPFTVEPDSNRIGLRLSGPELPRRIRHELPSEGVAVGSLQIPPSGRMTLFLADHPVTGGYPVIAVVASDDLDRAAQARPGQRMMFRPDPR